MAQKQPRIERVRNSSLAERARAENVPGLKHDTEAMGVHRWDVRGRGASVPRRSATGRGRGAARRENAGMSSEMGVGIPQAEYLRFPG